MKAKRPLLTRETRDHLRALAANADKQTDGEVASPNRAYAQGVKDTLTWLVGEDMTGLLREVTR